MRNQPATRPTSRPGHERGAPVRPFLQRTRLLGRSRRQAQVAGQETRRQPDGEQPADDRRRSTRAGLLVRWLVGPPAGPASSVLKMETAREGVSVMALMAEMIIDDGDGQGELAVELAGEAGDEAARQEHRA